MKTKIGTEVAHVTRDSDTTFKVKMSKVKVTIAHRRVGASGGCSGGRGNVLAVRNCCYVRCRLLGGARRFGAHRGGEGRGHIVAAARLQLVGTNILHCRALSVEKDTAVLQ